jgi:hypothetical protein
MKLKYILSLGYNCGAAYQIRLHTGIEEAGFFDWLYTSIEAATSLIETNFTDFLSPERVSIVRDGTEVLVRPSGIRLNHSFKPDGKNVDAEVMTRDFAREQRKFEYLAGKMRGIFDTGEPIGFVRYNPYLGHYDSWEKVLSLEKAIQQRLRHRRYTLYWVKNTGQTRIETSGGNITLVDIGEQPARSTSFRGRDFIGTDDVAWRQFIDSLDFNLQQRVGERKKSLLD